MPCSIDSRSTEGYLSHLPWDSPQFCSVRHQIFNNGIRNPWPASPSAAWVPRLIAHSLTHSLNAEQTLKLASGRSTLSQFLLEHSAFLIQDSTQMSPFQGRIKWPKSKVQFLPLCLPLFSLSLILELLPHVHRSPEVSSSLGQDQRVALQRSTPARALDLRSSHLSRCWSAFTLFCSPDPPSAESRWACTHTALHHSCVVEHPHQIASHSHHPRLWSSPKQP